MQKLTLLSLIAGVIFLGCSKKNSTADTKKLDKDSMIVQYELLKKSADNKWNLIEQADSIKVASAKRLLDEIEYNPKHNPKMLLTGREAVKNLEKYSYSQENIPDFDQVGRDDEVVDSLVQVILDIAESTPNMDERPLTQELIEDINEKNMKIFLPRKDYSVAASQFNEFVMLYAEDLAAEKKDTVLLVHFFPPEM